MDFWPGRIEGRPRLPCFGGGNADGTGAFSAAGSPATRRPKNRGPFQPWPVIARAIVERLVIGRVLPQEAAGHDRDGVPLALIFANEDGARLEAAVSSVLGFSRAPSGRGA